MNNILIVCVGNICRSPLAEHMLQSSLPGINVQSAGLAAVVGSDMDETARAVAMENGLEVPSHTAKQLTPEMVREADLILVMESRHREAVCHGAPESRGKVFLLGNFIGPTEISDPYGRSVAFYQSVHEKIASATESWVQRLTH